MEDRPDMPSFQVVGHESEPINVPAELAPEVRRMIALYEASAAGEAGRLEYRTPEAPRRRPVADWSLVFALAFFCGMLHFVSAVIVPVYEGHYRNLGTKLPATTVGIIRLSRFIVNDYGWVYIWPFALVIPVVSSAVFRTRGRDKRGFGLWCVLVLVAASFFLMVSLISLAAPLITLRQTVTGGAPGF